MHALPSPATTRAAAFRADTTLWMPSPLLAGQEWLTAHEPPPPHPRHSVRDRDGVPAHERLLGRAECLLRRPGLLEGILRPRTPHAEDAPLPTFRGRHGACPTRSPDRWLCARTGAIMCLLIPSSAVRRSQVLEKIAEAEFPSTRIIHIQREPPRHAHERAQAASTPNHAARERPLHARETPTYIPRCSTRAPAHCPAQAATGTRSKVRAERASPAQPARHRYCIGGLHTWPESLAPRASPARVHHLGVLIA
jgi:hypothetical protein